MVRWVLNVGMLVLLLALALVFLAPLRWDVDFRTVVSGSMEPTLPVGTIVVTRPVDPTHILPGDVISFPSPEDMRLVVTHRVMEVTVLGPERAFRTKGDANNAPDRDPVPASWVTGREILHIPYLGLVAQFVKTPRGWLLLVALPAAALVLLELVGLLQLIWRGGARNSIAVEKPAAACAPAAHSTGWCEAREDLLPRATWIPDGGTGAVSAPAFAHHRGVPPQLHTPLEASPVPVEPAGRHHRSGSSAGPIPAAKGVG